MDGDVALFAFDVAGIAYQFAQVVFGRDAGVCSFPSDVVFLFVLRNAHDIPHRRGLFAFHFLVDSFADSCAHCPRKIPVFGVEHGGYRHIGGNYLRFAVGPNHRLVDWLEGYVP